jgi:hypothetical protein
MVATEEYRDFISVDGGLHCRKACLGNLGHGSAIVGVGNIIVVIEVLVIGYRNVAMVMYLPSEGAEAFA